MQLNTVAWIVSATCLVAAFAPALFFARRAGRGTAGPGWRHIRREAGLEGSPRGHLPQASLGWSLGCLMVYALLFGAGSFLYGQPLRGMMFTGLGLGSAAGLWPLLRSMWRTDP